MITQQTVIVCGPEFSGTSLVAGTLRILGINMGSEFNPEDAHQEVLFNNGQFTDEITRTIADRNNKFKVWGAKTVGARFWLERSFAHLSNPVFLICCRSLYQCLNSGSKYSGPNTLINHAKEIAFLGEFISSHDVPVCFIDYDETPVRKLDKIIQFMGVDYYHDTYKKALRFNNGGDGYSVIN